MGDVFHMAVRSGATLADIPVALRSLSAALPSPLRRVLGFEPKRLLLELAIDRLTAQVFDGQDAGPRQNFSLDGAATTPALRALAAQPLDEIVLRLGPDSVLSVDITLPNTAIRALPALMPFELERLAPLPLGELCHGYEVTAGPPAVHVTLQMAPRAAILDVLALLRTLGVRPDRLIGAGDGLLFTHLNLLPTELRPPKPRSWVNKLAWGVAALALLAAVVSPFLYLMQQRSVIQAETALLKPQIAAQRDVARARGLEGAAAERARRVLAAKAAQPPAVLLLDTMTALLPDDVWLTQFNLADGQVEIEGYARAATTLVPLLEASPHFGAVRFLTPVTRDVVSGRERFHFAVALKQAVP